MTDRTFTGQVALVTGGSRGIGEGIARSLALSGATVVITARGEAALASAVLRIAAAGGAPPIGLAVDVTDVTAIQAMVDQTERELGPISMLVNKAGVNRPRSALNVTEAEWDQILDTNLKGPFFCAQAIGARMVERGHGRIVNIASAAGLRPAEDRAAYCANKAGLIMLTKELALEWSPRGVTVNAVAPTFVETELGSQTLNVPGKRDYWTSRIPRGRLATIDDVVAAVRYFLSKEADFITGVVLSVDGGLTM